MKECSSTEETSKTILLKKISKDNEVAGKNIPWIDQNYFELQNRHWGKNRKAAGLLKWTKI